ncbi:hypothetical protein RUM43_001665 [Polyplax serrata]|uniref:Purple acid phosphatase n=1 Tax=Polyplax serrata TaxID=468196 RepID=A0AAN8SE81_POLSC
MTTQHSFVWYGTLNEGFTFRAEGKCRKFTRRSGLTRYIHRVTLQNLYPNSVYVYRCGSFEGISRIFQFKTFPIGPAWSPRLIIYGDMGWEGAAIVPYLENEIKQNGVDVIAHIGDIAYNMDTDNGRVGDGFLRMIEPVASAVPYMTTMGNHEQAQYVLNELQLTKIMTTMSNLAKTPRCITKNQFLLTCQPLYFFSNFSHYKNAFSMPGRSEGMFYSFDLGPAHFVAISTEVYYFPQYGIESIKTQYNWLQNDLTVAFKNRHNRPWIIVLQHRPFYCSSDTNEDCSHERSILRTCCINNNEYGLEDLYYRNGVDIIFAGHMHYYERSWPLYNNEVYNGSSGPYTNPGATVHIITGAAGMVSGTETASNIDPNKFPFYSRDNSYTVLNIINNTHVCLEQISTTQNGQIIDHMWLIKEYKTRTV